MQSIIQSASRLVKGALGIKLFHPGYSVAHQEMVTYHYFQLHHCHCWLALKLIPWM